MVAIVLSRYFSTTSVHATVGDEIASTLESNMTAALRQYYDLNKRLPEQIFVYRDGVGEGQLEVQDL